MKNKLRELQYKPIIEFTSDKTYDRLSYLVSDRPQPAGSVFYAKILDQEIQYELTDGSTLSHRVSLTIFFLCDEINETIIDCFSLPSYPFDLRVDQDFAALANLFEIYKSDVKEIMNHENSLTA